MNVNSLLQIRKIISHIAYEEAVEIVKKIEKCKTADEVETIVFENIRQKWAHLFPADNMLSPKKI